MLTSMEYLLSVGAFVCSVVRRELLLFGRCIWCIVLSLRASWRADPDFESWMLMILSIHMKIPMQRAEAATVADHHKRIHMLRVACM